ncbi:MepB family protein [Candidatus Babeliales bacterium]|nr:MepB family protein [Candidatus Babeliales bacterium]MBP9843744.1 MepB family protein [Candidatus Babeliales bacterium]
MMPASFLKIQKYLHEQLGAACSDFKVHAEGKEYSAASFRLADFTIEFRVAKITPTKIGQFVTCWKRGGSGVTMPYDVTDRIDFFIIGVVKDEQVGFFLFPQKTLQVHNIISDYGKGGKRGFRVYPLWDTPDNKQAIATQSWQKNYFIWMEPHKNIDRAVLQKIMIG